MEFLNKIAIQHVPFHPPLHKANQVKSNDAKTFIDYLQDATSAQLKISKHASERMQERNIEISNEDWQLVTNKVIEAKQKGIQQPLILLDQAALIVSAKNGTVITALDRQEAKSQIFTNIDGTIVL